MGDTYNGAIAAVQECELRGREQAAMAMARAHSVADERRSGEFGSFSCSWESLDDVFPSQPRRFALSNATHREQTAKAPRGPALRGPRTWMRHRTVETPLPPAVEELDRYYTEVQNPIGRSAGTSSWRSNSERVVLAISQPPKTTWRDDVAGPEPSKKQQGTLLILKVSSGSVQNWRRVKESGHASRASTRDSNDSSATSSAQARRRPTDTLTRASSNGGFIPAAAHLSMPDENYDHDQGTTRSTSTFLPGEKTQSPATGSETPFRSIGSPLFTFGEQSNNHSVVKSDPILDSMSTHAGHQLRPAAAAPLNAERSERPADAKATDSKIPGSRGFFGSRLGRTVGGKSASMKSRPLTEATPTWRNTPSWESTGWFSRGSLLDSSTDAQVAPALRHGRSQPADCAHNWRPRYGALAARSFPFRPAPPQASKLGWSRFPLAGEVDNMGSGVHFFTQDERYRPSAPRRSSSAASRAEFVSQSFDNPGGLSRLNPNVPPRLQGPKLTDLRNSVIKTAAYTSLMEEGPPQ